MILNTEGFGQLPSRPLKLEEMWLRDPGSFFIVASAWAIHVDGQLVWVLQTKWDEVNKALRHWNKVHFVFIKDRLLVLTYALDSVQQSAPSGDNLVLESSIKSDIH